MKKIFCTMIMMFVAVTTGNAASQWEKQGEFYFLTKETKESFSLSGPGANNFTSKYLSFDHVDFLVKGPANWTDYGRLNLEGNNTFMVPIRPGMKLDEIHFLASGNYGNSYEHDSLLHMYGENYYYATLTVVFAYQDGIYKTLSVPVFWDWFHLPAVGWTKDGASIKAIGRNPMRKDCTMYHISFKNPRPEQAVKDILLMDSWLQDKPFSDIFAVTLKSSDTIDANPRSNQ